MKDHTVCHEQGHVLTLELPDEPLPHLSLDRERLTQLFGILLSNACSYTPKGTPIEICARSEPHFVELSVIDHGPGIPDPEKEAIFRRFYRGDASRTEKQHFGLGLSVAAELAALHAARLTVRDTPGLSLIHICHCVHPPMRSDTDDAFSRLVLP